LFDIGIPALIDYLTGSTLIPPENRAYGFLHLSIVGMVGSLILGVIYILLWRSEGPFVGRYRWIHFYDHELLWDSDYEHNAKWVEGMYEMLEKISGLHSPLNVER